MHQPVYELDGFFRMPWVRLHATKGYYDMASVLKKFPDMGLTINIVPSLFKQIKKYSEGAVDRELELSKKPVSILTESERREIVISFFQANEKTMINPLPRYRELLQKRDPSDPKTKFVRTIENFTEQDILDLQVLFNLAWFGFTLREEEPLIKALIQKGSNYTEDDKKQLLDIQRKVLGRLPELYCDLVQRGKVEISISPLNHPILPLLIDSDSAQVSMPDTKLPRIPFRSPEDAEKQIKQAVKYYKDLFGVAPVGMWPSEGAVSSHTLYLMNRYGISWTATDEGVLKRSRENFKRDHDIYRTWCVNGINIFFRDRGLADLIGFSYSGKPAEKAVGDFISNLENIANNPDVPDEGAVVSVILDGENPWEWYPESGKEFLELLYDALTSHEFIIPVSMGEYNRLYGPEGNLTNLHPGSWINESFDAWIGDQDENLAWEALGKARKILVEREKDLSDDKRAEVWELIYCAEGSDWFWWYGTDHTSVNDMIFDDLFRAYLTRVYNIIGEVPPKYLEMPFLGAQSVKSEASGSVIASSN